MKRQKKIGYKSSEKIGYETLILHDSSEKESKDFTGFFPKISLSKIGYILFVYIEQTYTST